MEGKVMTMVLSSSKPVHKKPAAPASGKPEAAADPAGKATQPAEH
jgi:hypothetical protein